MAEKVKVCGLHSGIETKLDMIAISLAEIKTDVADLRNDWQENYSKMLNKFILAIIGLAGALAGINLIGAAL
jgi:hypothetical protein